MTHQSSGNVPLHDQNSHRRNTPRRSSLVGWVAFAEAAPVVGAGLRGKSVTSVPDPSTAGGQLRVSLTSCCNNFSTADEINKEIIKKKVGPKLHNTEEYIGCLLWMDDVALIVVVVVVVIYYCHIYTININTIQKDIIYVSSPYRAY